MKRSCLLLLSIFISVQAHTIRYDISNGVEATTGDALQPVPRPVAQKGASVLICLPVSFTFTYSKNDCPLLRNYARDVHRRMLNPVMGATSGGCTEVSEISITVPKSCSEEDKKIYPTENMDESYVIIAATNGISIITNEVWGAMRALETLAQMVFRMDNGKIALFTNMITDSPRFAHRGLMLDTSRHYLHKDRILESLQLMAITKLNVFHWHIVDDQSFPYSSMRFPAMAQKGAYNPYSLIYTQGDVADVIEAGRRLGIRVIPEFDSPGHTQSWGKGLPDLLTKCYSGGKPNGNFGPIDPTEEGNYKSLTTLFGEILKVFPDSSLHLGGDEVSFACWQSNPLIADFMKKMQIASYSGLESYYINRLVKLVNGATPPGKNITTIVWQEVFDNKVKIPSNVLVHVWKNPWQKELASVTAAGYPALLSTCWYLNYISYGTDYGKYYNCDPQDFNGTQAAKNLIRGGEACMWGEYVDDSNVISRTWPRVSSVAEALWTKKERKDEKSFGSRILGLQCRMRQWGYMAQPPNVDSSCARPLPVSPGV